MNTNREEIVTFLTPSLKRSRQCYIENWYTRKNHDELLNLIKNETNFLNKNDNLAKRLYYIENNYTNVQKCVCGNERIWNKKTCGEKKCIIKIRPKQSLETKTKRKNAIINFWKDKTRVFSEEHNKNNGLAHRGIKQKESTKLKRSVSLKKFNKKNPTFRSKIMKDLWQKESYRQKFVGKPYPQSARIKQSNTMKRKIMNGEFVPNRYNLFATNNKRNLTINDITFRSSWEALFYLMKNCKLQYEKTKIEYFDDFGKSHIFIVDFVDYDNKILYEIKPLKFVPKISNKIKYAKEYAFNNNYKFFVVTENYFLKRQSEIKNFSNYSDKIRCIKDFLK